MGGTSKCWEDMSVAEGWDGVTNDNLILYFYLEYGILLAATIHSSQDVLPL